MLNIKVHWSSLNIIYNLIDVWYDLQISENYSEWFNIYVLKYNFEFSNESISPKFNP